MNRKEKVVGILSGHVGSLFASGLADEIDAVYAQPDPLRPIKTPQYSVKQVMGVWWHQQWHRKDIYSEPTSLDVKVPQEDIDWLWNLICEKWDVPPNPFDDPKGIDKKYRWELPQIAREIVVRKDLQIPVNSFNGGGAYNRVKYHAFYIYPIHVLAHMRRVRFGQTSWRLL